MLLRVSGKAISTSEMATCLSASLVDPWWAFSLLSPISIQPDVTTLHYFSDRPVVTSFKVAWAWKLGESKEVLILVKAYISNFNTFQPNNLKYG